MSESVKKFTLPVWLRLPNLPLEYWVEANLARLVVGVGEPLFMDEQTKQYNRCAFACVCILLDLSKRLPKGVWAQGLGGTFFQPTEFEGIPLIYLDRGKVGHKAEGCREPMQQVRKSFHVQNYPWAANSGQGKEAELDRAGSANQAIRTGVLNASSSDVDKEYGEWTIVTRRRRRLNLFRAGMKS
ncbi:uncharacterized protein LOC110093711 [Dendrobium catenatum]|uniref:uncharacterized protein LOC110093711 n=1 Tax=Dendrobium catenatum TaxID=906689 RepID=UPI0009F641DD|nr:uncharacterized protein LOC110093711 [Dendrobium catenatum]